MDNLRGTIHLPNGDMEFIYSAVKVKLIITTL